MLVFRVPCAAKHLTLAVLDRIAASSPPNTYFYENKHFIPGGSVAAARILSEKYQLAAVDNADGDMKDRKAMSAIISQRTTLPRCVTSSLGPCRSRKSSGCSLTCPHSIGSSHT